MNQSFWFHFYIIIGRIERSASFKFFAIGFQLYNLICSCVLVFRKKSLRLEKEYDLVVCSWNISSKHLMQSSRIQICNSKQDDWNPNNRKHTLLLNLSDVPMFNPDALWCNSCTQNKRTHDHKKTHKSIP